MPLVSPTHPTHAPENYNTYLCIYKEVGDNGNAFHLQSSIQLAWSDNDLDYIKVLRKACKDNGIPLEITVENGVWSNWRNPRIRFCVQHSEPRGLNIKTVVSDDALMFNSFDSWIDFNYRERADSQWIKEGECK